MLIRAERMRTARSSVLSAPAGQACSARTTFSTAAPTSSPPAAAAERSIGLVQPLAAGTRQQTLERAFAGRAGKFHPPVALAEVADQELPGRSEEHTSE